MKKREEASDDVAADRHEKQSSALHRLKTR